MTASRVSLREGDSTEQELSQQDAAVLNASGLFDARPTKNGLWRIAKQGKAEVGSVRVGHLDVHIAPKLPIRRVLFLLGFADAEKQRIRWKPDTVALKDDVELVPAFAHLLWRRAEQALAPGLLTGYVARDAASTVLRGRLRETDQLYRSHGLGHPLQVRYDDLTPDIPENQILKTALIRMLGLPGVDAESQLAIRRQLSMLADISILPPNAPPPRWIPTRLNMRYAEALTLAGLVLRNRSAEHGPGVNVANGFLVNMEYIFEDFVRTAIGQELVRIGGGDYGKPTLHLDTSGQLKIEPDLVWTRHGRSAAVVDAKYFKERPKLAGNREGIYQMLAYCVAEGVKEGHLIYAAGHANPTTYTVKTSGIRITCHALNLDQDPADLISDVRDLANVIANPVLMPAEPSDLAAP
jgi:5-methylcytosine-specific restriction enzyme subunit McrC